MRGLMRDRVLPPASISKHSRRDAIRSRSSKKQSCIRVRLRRYLLVDDMFLTGYLVLGGRYGFEPVSSLSLRIDDWHNHCRHLLLLLKCLTPLCATTFIPSSPGIKNGCHSRKILTNDMHMLITSLMPPIPASVDIHNLVKYLRLDLT
jgi:hypothetical protein